MVDASPPPPPSPPTALASGRRVVPQEAIVAGLLLAEIAIFTLTGHHFATSGNAFELLRDGAVLGLIAVAMTPVLLSGGIDLSVGSLIGLSAVVLGALWRDGGLPVWAAAAVTVALGAVAGGLNALLVTRLRIPPLIVTLGTWSLFRGLAESLTRGVDNYTGFPDHFTALWQGAIGGIIPVQAPVLVLVALGVWLAVERMPWGRELRAIGFSPEGARHAGIPVGRRVASAYILSGTIAALAAVIYVAHVGQAKADTGTGYELLAITAVVLGGCSIAGGIGTIHGTLLAVAVLIVLRNGLRLSDGPAELAGILIGALLIAAIAIRSLTARLAARRVVPVSVPPSAVPPSSTVPPFPR